MIIDRHEPRKPVVYLRGSTFLWSQIEAQLPAASRSDEPIHLEIQRWTVDRQSCVGLDRKLAQFLANLDGAVANPGHAGTKEPEEILLDATTFRIHMAAKDARLTIAPDGPRNPPLQHATSRWRA